MSGHEHSPSATVVQTEQSGDLLMLGAGATVPPHSDREFGYCYNVIEFSWAPADESLLVDLRPRRWMNERKRFEADEEAHCGRDPRFVLACPSFRRALVESVDPIQQTGINRAAETVPIDTEGLRVGSKGEAMADTYAMLRLRFFRDITSSQRIHILASLGAIPHSYSGPDE